MNGPNAECTHKRTTHIHGTRTCYVFDKCRCDDCREAKTAYERERRCRKAYAQWNPELADLVDAEPVREHIRRLSTQGMGWKRVAAAAGIGSSTVYPILYGKHRDDPNHPDHRPPRKQVRREIAEALLAVELALADGVPVDATGTRRRLQALVAIGWSQSSLSRRLDMGKGNFSALLKRSKVSVRTDKAVRALYDELWNTPPTPTNRWQATAITSAKRHAAAQGWLPPMAWDDDTIDDPDVQPMESADEVTREDEVRWLLDAGESPEQIAARLGVRPDTLEHYLRRVGQPDMAAPFRRKRVAA